MERPRLRARIRATAAAKTFRQLRLLVGVARDGCRRRRRFYDRAHIEGWWDFEAPAERARHRRVVGAIVHELGNNDWGDVLEIGCSKGVFTEELSRRCRNVVATDISPVACVQARKRLDGRSNVRVEQLDMERDDLGSNFDVVLAMDVFDYVHGRRRLGRVVGKLARTLRKDGLLVLTSTRLPAELEEGRLARRLGAGGISYVELLSHTSELRLLSTELVEEPLRHVVAVYQRVDESSSGA